MTKVLLCVTGSISAYKAASIASALQNYRDCEVIVMMTDAAQKLVTTATFAGITHKKVYTDNDWFTEAEDVPHIKLAKWADKILVCPATANTIAKFANGIADNLISATFLAASGMEKSITICPAMNTNMYNAVITINHIGELKKHSNIKIIEPKSGKLACGDEGVGHLKDTKAIISEFLD